MGGSHSLKSPRKDSTMRNLIEAERHDLTLTQSLTRFWLRAALVVVSATALVIALGEG
jgi:hypothetical protein